MPRYELLNERNSIRDPKYFYNLIPVQATRGCPHGCEFCLVSDIYGKKARKKTIPQIRAEILAVKRQLPNRLIGFVDDNLFVDRHFSRELLQTLEQLQVRWVAQTDIAVGADPDLLKRIYRAGCLFLFIGFESLDCREPLRHEPEPLENAAAGQLRGERPQHPGERHHRVRVVHRRPGKR